MRSLVLLLMLCSLYACYEPTEGCLDIRATNFDLDADRTCPDCCTYPDLKIRFSHVWAYADTTLTLDLDTFYHDAQGQPFRIEQIRFYWSDMVLQLNDGSRLVPADSIDLSIQESSDTITLSLPDNFLLSKTGSSTSTHTIGEIQPEGTATSLEATFGVVEPANRALEGLVSPTSHPLAPQLGGMNLGPDLGYVFAKLELYRDTAATDTIPLVLHLYGEDFRRSLNLTIDPPVMLFEGMSPTVSIQADYAQWFEGVNIRSSDTSGIKTQIVNNLTESFRVLEVDSN